MATGLKTLVDKAMQDEKPALPPDPVEVSDDAVFALSEKIREWTGWPNARVQFGKPDYSPYAECDHHTRVITANPETLVLNPHRVLLTITPFRLRQEAVLTGALLHEAGHARHSHWKPRNPSEVGAPQFNHSDGTAPSKMTVKFAMLMEEPRVEGLMARDADHIGAQGLGWTMRASAAALLPFTARTTDPQQQIMDLITSWTLRAGRQIAVSHHLRHHAQPRRWVQHFTTLVHDGIETYLDNISEGEDADPAADTRKVMDLMLDMMKSNEVADRGPYMIDTARDILAILFPETNGDSDDAPEPGGCESQPEEDETGDESDEQTPGEGEADEEGDEPGDGGAEGEGGDGEDGDSDTESDESEGDSGSPDTGEAEGESEGEADDALAKALRHMEERVKTEQEEENQKAADEAPPLPEDSDDPSGAGNGGKGHEGGGWRRPSKEEREIQKGAEHFLRSLIDPSESSKISLTDTPSATVDGAALAAWKAGGEVRDPHFFRRTRRTTEPSPPVKIAVLVDVSGSMDSLQRPSAILSWALSAAALDLRNFAGRGQQIESCMIHWGSSARVIQKNGEPIPGIREFGCYEGTSAMHMAHDLVTEEMPGFFDITEQPVNRLLVHFTDWELGWGTRQASTKQIQQALAAGVNMITVAPQDYSERRSDLADILSECRIQRGSSTLLKYNPQYPAQVWDTAAAALSGTRPAPFAGF